MTDYIKRIQSNLSRKNIKLSKPAIREELGILGYSNETLTDDLTTLVISTLVSKFGEEVETKLLPECEPLNVLIPQDSENNHQELETELQTNLETELQADTIIVPEPEREPEQELILDKCVAEKLILDKLPEPKHESESGLVVSEEEKHDLITLQASELGFTLTEEEATCIADTVDEIFESYTHLVDAISTAVKSYFDHRFDSVEERLSANSNNLRQHFSTRKQQLNQKIAGFKNDVKADLGGIRADIKSVQFGFTTKFTERLRIPAKT